jgi:hypothetical protein
MRRPFLFICLSLAPLAGCLHIKMDVYAKVDVNVKLEKAVTDVLTDIYGDSTTVNTDALPAASATEAKR